MKRAIKIAAGGRRHFAQMEVVNQDAADAVHQEEEEILESGSEEEDGEDNEAANDEHNVINEAEMQEDDGKISHDNAITRSLHDRAIAVMKDEGVETTIFERKEALQLFPRVSIILLPLFWLTVYAHRFLVLHDVFMTLLL